MSAAAPGDRPGSGSGTAATEKAAYLQLLHDDIAEAVRTEDVAALGWAVEQLRPVLATTLLVSLVGIVPRRRCHCPDECRRHQGNVTGPRLEMAGSVLVGQAGTPEGPG